MRLRVLLPVAVALAMPWARPAAQPSAQTPTQPASAAGAITPTVFLRVRPEMWDWFGDTDEADPYAFVGVHARLGVMQQLPRWGWRVELAAPALLGLPSGESLQPAPRGQLGLGASYLAANDGERSVAGIFLRQAFVRFGRPPAAGGPALRLGRFEFNDGTETVPANGTLAALKRDRISQRLVGTFGFTHVQRTFDGAHFTYDRRGGNATLLVVRPTQGVFDVDGWPDLDVTVGYGALTMPIRAGRFAADARIFAAHYRDDRDHDALVKTDNRPAARRTADDDPVAVTTLGAHWLQSVRTAAGELDLLLWGAVQTGDWGTQSHRGEATAAEIGWQPPGLARLRPWIRGGWYRASGDDSPDDDRHETFFSMLPTPRPYARFPFYSLMNVEDASGSLILRPAASVTARLDARSLRLDRGQDLWYVGGGAFEENTFGYAGRPANGRRQLASLYDVGIDWRVTPRWTLGLYGAAARGGPVVHRVYPERDYARFGYVELQYSR